MARKLKIMENDKHPLDDLKNEFLLEHGFVDKIVERENMKNVLTEILRLHNPKGCEFNV